MGLHTWFYKDRILYDEEQSLHDKLEQHDNNEIWLDDLELLQINHRIDEIDELNNAGYNDLFRTFKREADDSYTLDVIYSSKECKQWLIDNDKFIYFSHTIHDTPEQIAENKEKALIRLAEFWDKYPDGVIDFG